MAQMNNYLNNNIVLINMYENLYANGIRIDEIIQMFKKGEFAQYSGFDFGRFRVFVDGCLLLLNKEKLNRYYKDEYCFAKFIDKVSDDPQLIPYINYIQNEDLFSEIEDVGLYHSMEGKAKRTWDQVWTIRNALAHMQYGNFQFQESGQLICYYLYNKDKGVRKDVGIVFEPILHEFVKSFFSNYSFGIPFRNTFFMKYSMKNMRKTLRMRYYEITSLKGVDEVYDGYSENSIANLIKRMNDMVDLPAYLSDNKNKFDIKEYKISEKINENHFRRIAKNYELNDKNKYFYGLKTFLDFETEISNFLVHIGQLNEALRKYVIDNSIKKDGTQKYVVERIRNSLMHGNFNIEATSRGEILVIFTDTYNKRSDVIKVTLNKLKVFLCQPSLYVGIPSETDVMLFQRQDI